MGSATIRNCKFAFKCSKQWDDLVLTAFDQVRHCNSCERDVFYCRTDADLADSIRLNRCIAVDLCEAVPDLEKPLPDRAPLRLLGMPAEGDGRE